MSFMEGFGELFGQQIVELPIWHGPTGIMVSAEGRGPERVDRYCIYERGRDKPTACFPPHTHSAEMVVDLAKRVAKGEVLGDLGQM